MPKEYRTIQEVAGPLMLVRGVEGVTYDELGEIELVNGETRRCKVLEVNGSDVLVQLFESSTGINLSNSKVRFPGKEHGAGRVRGYAGDVSLTVWGPPDRRRPGDPAGGADRISTVFPMNPAARSYPEEFHPDRRVRHRRAEHSGARAEAADLLGFGSAPCPARGADRTSGERCLEKTRNFAVVFAAMGITFEESNFFIESFRETGALDRTVAVRKPGERPCHRAYRNAEDGADGGRVSRL